jgi:alkanesulfonate monooxygenase SsuD/methylene tetrahydromethanopterin reductase-like flavin-dependent oxidoreductase (luciferase family)
MANFQRVIHADGGATPADVAVLGDESSVREQLEELVAMGVTDIWAQPVPVGADRPQRRESLQRTRTLLRELARDGGTS